MLRHSQGGAYLPPEPFYNHGVGAAIMMNVLRNEMPDLVDGSAFILYPSLYRQWLFFDEVSKN